jgi:RNA recognition motif. (a.k.a. RRM, RBD, or RNP domain)
MGEQFANKGLNYGFVEYDDPGAAERAMQTLNGRRIHQSVSHFGADLLSPICAPLTDLGNPSQLGLPVEQHQQGGYKRTLPYFRW